jgi:hypothetical protein
MRPSAPAALASRAAGLLALAPLALALLAACAGAGGSVGADAAPDDTVVRAETLDAGGAGDAVPADVPADAPADAPPDAPGDVGDLGAMPDGGADGAGDTGDTASAGPACPAGSVAAAGACRFPCPAGWQRDEATGCLPPCPAGWQAVEGVCAAPCPEGMVADGPLCAPAADGPRPCAGGRFDPAGSEGAALVLHVDAAQGSGAGDGTAERPYATIDHALAAAPAGTTSVAVLLAAGAYEFPALREREGALRLLGACADAVSIEGAYSVDAPALDLALERVTLAADTFAVYAVGALAIRDAALGDAAGPGGIVWGAEAGALVLERDRIAAGAYVSTLAPLVDGTFRANRFEGGADVALEVGPGGARFEDNRFEGGRVEVSGCAGDAGGLRLARNRFEPGGEGDGFGGVRIAGCAGAVLEDNSFADLAAAAIELDDAPGATLVRNRVVARDAGGGAAALVVVRSSQAVTLEGTLLWGSPGHGVDLVGASSATLTGTYAAACAGAGVFVASVDGIADVQGGVFVGNRRGLEVSRGTLRVAGAAIAAHRSQGVHAWRAAAVEVTGCTIAGNGGAGVTLVALADESPTGFRVRGCRLQENVALGVLVRSGGPLEVALEDNTVLGTRPGELMNAQGETGAVGDGLAVLTGTDLVASRVALVGNTVEGNARLGILVHGADTTAVIRDTRFGAGNGWDGTIRDVVSAAPDLVVQEGSVVTGPDADRSQTPLEPIFTALALGGGGDPR